VSFELYNVNSTMLVEVSPDNSVELQIDPAAQVLTLDGAPQLVLEQPAPANLEFSLNTPTLVFETGPRGPQGAAGTSAGGYTFVDKSADFTADGPAFTFYRITAASPLAVQFPPSPGDGRVQKFKRISGAARVTYLADAGEFIDNCGIIDDHLDEDSSDVIEVIAAAGGWYIT
jgi:hypothetical protein